MSSRQQRRFLEHREPKRRLLPSLGVAGAVALMALAGLDGTVGGKVVWSPGHNAVVWSSPNSNAAAPDWVKLFPIPLVTTIFKVNGDISFANPGDWNDASNKVECIGSGGSGAVGSAANRGGSAGGGGAYAVRLNIPILASGEFPVTLQIPLGSSLTPTQFNNPSASTARKVIATFGRNATAALGGIGGPIANCTPSTALSGGVGSVPGGDGGVRGAAGVVPGAGGGGVGGPNGAGSTGGSPTAGVGGTGGNADGGTVIGPSGPTTNTNGTIGNGGTEFDASHGCGTGGTGGGTTSGNVGGNGGNYGGGGGGTSGNAGTTSTGGAALIIISYTPPVGPTYTIALGAGAYSLSGQSVGLMVARKLLMGAGAYVLSGQNVGLIKTSANVGPPPSGGLHVATITWPERPKGLTADERRKALLELLRLKANPPLAAVKPLSPVAAVLAERMGGIFLMPSSLAAMERILQEEDDMAVLLMDF